MKWQLDVVAGEIIHTYKPRSNHLGTGLPSGKQEASSSDIHTFRKASRKLKALVRSLLALRLYLSVK